MDRLDALADDPGLRYRALRGAVLDPAPDEELQRIVAAAARHARAPMAWLGLVLEHTELLRAHHGLPADLALAGAFDREAGLSQLVVRDRMALQVDDIAVDWDVPQDASNRLGLRAYLGVPVRIGPHVVGALVVVDEKVREFQPQDRALLERLAAACSERLELLAHTPTNTGPLQARSAAPLKELRNGLAPLRDDTALARVLTADVAPIVRLATSDIDTARVRPLLKRAAQGMTEVARVLEDLEIAGARLQETVILLEATLDEDRGPAHLEDVLRFADGLVRHITHASGGVRWTGLVHDVVLRASRGVAAGVLATVLSEIAHRQDVPLGTDAEIVVDDMSVTIALHGALSTSDAIECAESVTQLLGDHVTGSSSPTYIAPVADGVVVRLVRAFDA